MKRDFQRTSSVFSWKELSSDYCGRNQPSEMFCNKGVLRNVTKFTGKHLCQTSGLQLYLKRDSGTGVFL